MNTPTPADLPAVADAAPRPPSRLPSVLLVLLVNAVPLIGVLRYDWSAINVLVLYWFENLLIAVCTCIRIAVHRSLTRKRGHWRGGTIGVAVNGKTVRSGLLGEYATLAFAFTLGHGVFVGMIALLLAQNHPDEPMWQLSFVQVGRAALVIAAMLAVELVADLSTIRSRSFAWISDYAQRRVGRVIVLHLAIIFGMLAMAMTDSPLAILYVLIGLKTLSDLGGQSGARRPATSFADKPGSDEGNAKDLARKRKKAAKASRHDAIEDEKPLPMPAHRH